MQEQTFKGHIVDVLKKRIFSGSITVLNGKIAKVEEDISGSSDQNAFYIMPGFIDAHIHIESSLLVPSEFARLSAIHGTIATVSDPHEIANVLGIQGVRYMLKSASSVPFKFYFGASSCVPATAFETAGAALSVNDIKTLFEEDGLKYLSEMMNYPGVLNRDPEVWAKITLAKSLGKSIDGHAPGLMGDVLKKYIEAGITTDHETYRLDEAQEKIAYGMKVIIREGSAAKNYEALHSLIDQFPEKVMFCSDDKHCHELIHGHINTLVKRSVREKGHDLMNVLQVAAVNPVRHYGLDVGLLQKGDPADFIIVRDLESFDVLETYCNGSLIAKEGKSLIPRVMIEKINHFNVDLKVPADFAIKAEGHNVRVIEAIDGEIITKSKVMNASIDSKNNLISDVEHDLLKIVVVNRYKNAPIKAAFVKNFGFEKGAIASSVAHDSHNIIAVGVGDNALCQVVNKIIEHKGGLSCSDGTNVQSLALPIAGLMSDKDGFEVAKEYVELESFIQTLHPTLTSPFMTLSFLALLVIPELKLSDLGLFDATKFTFTDSSF